MAIDKLEEKIAEVIEKMGLKKLPLLPDRHTMHLMAKAAVTVYEATVGNEFLEGFHCGLQRKTRSWSGFCGIGFDQVRFATIRRRTVFVWQKDVW
jgi:hypothetical protein